MDERYEPTDIDVDREKAVTVTFQDGRVTCLDLMTLRRGCPCAGCRSLRDQGQTVWPRADSPTPLRIEDAALHGAWGLAITWNDGHATGIFPFELLRHWHDAAADPGSAADHDRGR